MASYHLFISHSWQYSDAYEKLVSLLDNRASDSRYFDYVNYSVPKDDPVHTNGTDWQLEAAISNHMRPAQVILILAGVYSSYSKWIKKEVSIAQSGFSSPKPIIAVEPWGSEHTSRPVKDAANRVVKWNTNSIVNAIRELAQ